MLLGSWFMRKFGTMRRLVAIVCLFVLIVFCVLALESIHSEVLSAVRADVQGEGLWSKAQKEAVISLTSYARTHSEKDYNDYLEALNVTLGDKQARIELEKRNPDMEVVRRGFIQGRNHPDDVQSMAMLFRRFRYYGYMANAIDIWARADVEIEHLQTLGMQLH